MAKGGIGVTARSTQTGLLWQERADDALPFGLQRILRDRLAGLPVPVSGIAEVALDAMQIGVDPGRCRRLFVHHDLVRLIPLALGGPPKCGQRRLEARRRCGARQAGSEIRDAHHHLGGVNRPAACSRTSPSENSVSSSNGRPISCSPSGRPWASLPAGTAIPGNPAMFTVTVKMSLRYISTGSAPFSPTPNAADGVAGVRIAFTPLAKQSSKSRLIRVRTFCARR